MRDRKEMEKSLTELLALETPRLLLKEQTKIVDTGKRQPTTVPMQPYFFQYHLAFIGALSQHWSEQLDLPISLILENVPQDMSDRFPRV